MDVNLLTSEATILYMTVACYAYVCAVYMKIDSTIALCS
jgi:hypothetical protein